MVTRTTIARLQDRIEAVISRFNPEPPKPRHPGLDWLRQMMMRFGDTQEEAEARLAEGAREGHESSERSPRAPPLRSHGERGGGESRIRRGKREVHGEAAALAGGKEGRCVT